MCGQNQQSSEKRQVIVIFCDQFFFSCTLNWKASKVENTSKNYVNLYHLIKSNVMPAATMFSKFKSGSQQNQSNPIEANPITQVSGRKIIYPHVAKTETCNIFFSRFFVSILKSVNPLVAVVLSLFGKFMMLIEKTMER